MSVESAKTFDLPAASAYGMLDRALRTRLLAQMSGLRETQLTLADALGACVLGSAAGNLSDLLRATIRVNDAKFYRAIAANGSVGAAQAYMDGHWECDDLVAVVRMLVRNRALLDAMETGLARIGGMAMQLWNRLRRNTRDGSRRNIAAHYDLGNDFFALFLDENLMYSSAIFASENETLEQASTRKLDRICQKLNLQPGDRVIEIGSGWGGFAIHAARNYGCHITTATISSEQYDLAHTRVREAGLDDHIDVQLNDYRDLHGEYDKLVSIEMIEAIGHQYLDTYFAKVGTLLKPNGMALIQAITIEDHRYAQALRAVDFIKRYIFPGSFIPSISAMLGAMAKTSDMKLFQLEDIGPSYAHTLRAWSERFHRRLADVRRMGCDERFIRMWEFYFAYCEGGFAERSTGCVQMLLAKPGCRRESYLPDLVGNAIPQTTGH